MFSSLLIANRGEIARRVMRTARRLGIETVAVHSDADADAAFVRDADQAVHIGGAAAADSYLRGDRIIEAALATGAQAIHPGYGFLSENAAFAEAVVNAGLTWIGPPPSAIRAMGLKDAAKALMLVNTVPTTPGYHGEDQSAKRLKAEAKSIGYPVLIKAVAGGGGRGMRRVDQAGDFDVALESAKREAASSFGDDRVLVEKFVTSPRHIEVQVFGDSHGGVIHLFERDCSLQRRRQKVIEEAPAPGMTAKVRDAMTSAAVAAARAVGYQNAGTVEFIVDGSGPLRADGFWFMEMNTRLQVEHPVTELITGLDLVELQFRVACGERVPEQGDIELNGHAVEARLCAEDQERGFLPSSGLLEAFDLSAFEEFSDTAILRLDSAVQEGDVVPSSYDSMIAKAIAWAPTRDEALDALRDGLESAEIWPLVTNAPMLARLCDHPVFRAGTAATDLIESDPAIVAAPDQDEVVFNLALGAAGLSVLNLVDLADPWAAAEGFRVNSPSRLSHVFAAADRNVELVIETDETGSTLVSDLGRQPFEAEVEYFGDIVVVSGSVGDLSGGAIVRYVGHTPVLFRGGRAITLRAAEYGADLEGLAAGDDVRAPMPGKILDVRTRPGADVKKGDPLIVLEAMKMEHTLTAPRDGRVATVDAVAGSQTADGVVLVKLEPAD